MIITTTPEASESQWGSARDIVPLVFKTAVARPRTSL